MSRRFHRGGSASWSTTRSPATSRPTRTRCTSGCATKRPCTTTPRSGSAPSRGSTTCCGRTSTRRPSSPSHGVTIEGYDQGQDLLITRDEPEPQLAPQARVACSRRERSPTSSPRCVPSRPSVLDDARDRGEIDIVAEFSTHLPMMVIAEMLGLPIEIRAASAPLLRPHPRPPRGRRAGNITDATQAAMAEMTMLLLRDRRRQGEATWRRHRALLLTAQVTDDEGNEVALTHEQVAFRLLELAIAGHETTAKLIANGVVALDLVPGATARARRGSFAHPGRGRGDAAVGSPVALPGSLGRAGRHTPRRDHPRRLPRRCSSPAPPTTTSGSSPIPSTSISIAISSVTSASDSASTSASAPRWLVSRRGSRSRSSWHAIRTTRSRRPWWRAYSSNVRGLSNLPLALDPAA